MTIEASFQRGFPVRKAKPAAPGLFGTPGLSGVSGFATPRPQSPTAPATRLIPQHRPGRAGHRHEMIQPDVPLWSGAW
jgi:hypothetical protein